MVLTKAVIINLETKIPIPVMFNPPQYTLKKTNQFAEIGIPGLGSSLLQFVRGSSQTLTMTLFFDTTDLGIDVRISTDLVIALTDINAQTHGPPKLLFVWGSLVFPCVLEGVDQSFELFNPAGLPLRANLTVTLRGYDLIESLIASIPLESSDRLKGRIVRSGDTLQSISAEEYDDPRKWRAIAEDNNIDNPLIINPGKGITIPILDK